MSGKRIRQSLLIVVFLVLPALFLRARAKDPASLNVFDRGVLRMVAPLQKGFFYLGWSIRSWVRGYFFLVEVQKDNQRLREENELLRSRAWLPTETKSTEENPSLQTGSVVASVIGFDTLPYPSRTIFVQWKGDTDKIKPGLPVIGTRGVVGRIAAVYGNQAKVQTIQDPQFALAVQVERSKKLGVLRGGGTGKPMLLDYIEPQIHVEKGELVNTAGLGTPDSAPVFPAGLPVGTVEQVNTTPSGLYLKIDISAIEKPEELRRVRILTDVPSITEPKPLRGSSSPHRAGTPVPQKG